jgi:hypothetical protein
VEEKGARGGKEGKGKQGKGGAWWKGRTGEDEEEKGKIRMNEGRKGEEEKGKIRKRMWGERERKKWGR